MYDLSIPEAIKYLINMPISEWVQKLPGWLLILQIFINTVLPPAKAKKFNIVGKMLDALGKANVIRKPKK